jgi:hypothetical protein
MQSAPPLTAAYQKTHVITDICRSTAAERARYVAAKCSSAPGPVPAKDQGLHRFGCFNPTEICLTLHAEGLGARAPTRRSASTVVEARAQLGGAQARLGGAQAPARRSVITQSAEREPPLVEAQAPLGGAEAASYRGRSLISRCRGGTPERGVSRCRWRAVRRGRRGRCRAAQACKLRRVPSGPPAWSGSFTPSFVDSGVGGT